jgi:hypothetical protein
MYHFRSRYALYPIDEKTGQYNGEKPHRWGFSPSPSWGLTQDVLDALVKREYKAVVDDLHESKSTVITQGPGNYEIKRYPSDPMANSKLSVARSFLKRLWRRV